MVIGNFLLSDLTVHQFWVSYNHNNPILSYDVHNLAAFGIGVIVRANAHVQYAHAQYHMTRLSGITHIFESITPICLFILKLAWGYEEF